MPVFIETKFCPPHQPQDLVALARLDAVLEASLVQSVVCLSAPAGFGKTTLMLRQRRMLEQQGCRVAWINLDRDDNAPARLLQYLIGALQRACAHSSRPAPPGADARTPAALKATLLALCAEVELNGGALAFMLDDYHHIEHEDTHALLAWLAGTTRLRIVIGSRHRLPPRLAALDVCQLGVDVLSFTPDEAASFLRSKAGSALSDAHTALLFQKTEGWAAGLQLAAMGWRKHGGESGFVRDFSGADCDIGAYLHETVLAQVPPAVLRFLEITALFERFSLALCREALHLDDAADCLAWIVAHNLFLTPLDHRPRWFRYHRLLSDHLRGALRNAPERAQAAYLAASLWCEQRRLDEEAMQYAFSARDLTRAAELLERGIGVAGWLRGDHDRIMDWFARLPQAAVRARFPLRLAYVRAALWCGRLPQARQALAQVEADLASGAADPACQRELALCRYMLGVFTNDVAWLSAHRERWSAECDVAAAPLEQARMLLAQACFAFLEHDFDQALQLSGSAQALYQQTDSYAGEAGCRRMRCVIAFERGEASQAQQALARLYRDQCRVLGANAVIAANTGIRLAEAAYECNDIATARGVLAAAFGVSSQHGLQTNFISAFVTMSRVLRLDGHAHAADQCLDDGVALGLERNLPRVTLALQGERVRVHLADGRLDDALRAAGLVQLGPHAHATPGGRATSDGSDAALIEIRIALATGHTDGLGRRLDDLLAEARYQQRLRWQIKLLTLKSRLLEQLGRLDDACAILRSAVELGEAGAVLRSIIDEGPQVHALLGMLAQEQASASAWIATVYAAAGPAPARIAIAPATTGAAVRMSARESAILRLLECGFDNRRLAAQLVISEGTAKWHLRNIFQKLSVSSRTAAIARARSLRLL